MPGGIDPHTHLEAAMFDTVACDDFTRYSQLLPESSPELLQASERVHGPTLQSTRSLDGC